MTNGGRDDDDDDAGYDSPWPSRSPDPGSEPTERSPESHQPDARGFVRDLAGRVALDIATTAEGRAAGLSVEVWPAQGVWLRVRRGHELRIFVERMSSQWWVRWERVDPAPRGGRPQTSQGSLGTLEHISAAEVRAFLARWVAWRARQ